MAPKPKLAAKTAEAAKGGAVSKGVKTTPRSGAAKKASPAVQPKVAKSAAEASPAPADSAAGDAAKSIEELQERLAAAEARAEAAEAKLAAAPASAEAEASEKALADSATKLAEAEEKIRTLEREAELMRQSQEGLQAEVASLKQQLSSGGSSTGAREVDVSAAAPAEPPAAAAPAAAPPAAPAAAPTLDTLSSDTPYRVTIELDPTTDSTDGLQVRVQLDVSGPPTLAPAVSFDAPPSARKSKSAVAMQRITRGRQSRKRMIGTRIEGGGGLATPRSTPEGAEDALIMAAPPSFSLGAPPVPAA